MDVTLMWFECKNKDCNFIPLKTRQEKVKRAWRFGESVIKSARPRMFMRYVEGNYRRLHDGDIIIFDCKYGAIYMYDANDMQPVNSYYNPLKDIEMCNPCIEKLQNEERLFQ